jgi:hypothetical protein
MEEEATLLSPRFNFERSFQTGAVNIRYCTSHIVYSDENPLSISYKTPSSLAHPTFEVARDEYFQNASNNSIKFPEDDPNSSTISSNSSDS